MDILQNMHKQYTNAQPSCYYFKSNTDLITSIDPSWTLIERTTIVELPPTPNNTSICTSKTDQHFTIRWPTTCTWLGSEDWEMDMIQCRSASIRQSTMRMWSRSRNGIALPSSMVCHMRWGERYVKKGGRIRGMRGDCPKIKRTFELVIHTKIFFLMEETTRNSL